MERLANGKLLTMKEASETPDFEFDLALSFAGEDREYVQEIADRLKEAGLRVFYDTDYQVDMWGEDLVEYLDQIYRVKARYAIIFISRYYAEKMWPRHERRSALARALDQRSAYVLPVRLDSTPLDGLRPTVGYLDARRLGLDGIVNTTLAKLAGSKVVQPSTVTRAPRTEAERQQLLAQRPPAWEFLYFAGQLLYERDSIEGKYRDHEIRYASSSAELVPEAEFFSYISHKAGDAKNLTDKLTRLVTDEAVRERAFGVPGESGDPDRIAHLAKRWNSVYEEFMDWAAKLRAVSAPPRFHIALELLARFADGPIQLYRDFVDAFVAQADAIPATIAAGETPRLEATLVLSIDDEIVKAFNDELDRLATNP